MHLALLSWNLRLYPLYLKRKISENCLENLNSVVLVVMIHVHYLESKLIQYLKQGINCGRFMKTLIWKHFYTIIKIFSNLFKTFCSISGLMLLHSETMPWRTSSLNASVSARHFKSIKQFKDDKSVNFEGHSVEFFF